MYKIAKMIIKTSIKNKAEAASSLEDLFWMFYQNGQILKIGLLRIIKTFMKQE